MVKRLLRLLIVLIVLGVHGAGIYYVSTVEHTEVYQAAPIQAVIPSKPGPLSLLFIGDVMLDRSVATRAKREGFASLTKNVESMFAFRDLIVANLEGVISEEESISQKNAKILRFTFDPEVTDLLKTWGPVAVSLSNNHTDDFGGRGLAETKVHLGASAIPYFGSPSNTEDLSVQVPLGDKMLCLVGYEEFIRPDTAPFVKEIARLTGSCNYLVVTMHAGVEYAPGASTHQQKIAHEFVDAGADLVIGTHPHVVEPLEIYRGKAIFYSLGNFIFDQDFSFETSHGLAVGVEIDDYESRFTLLPIAITKGEVTFASREASEKILSALAPNASIDVQSRIFTLPAP